MKVLPLRIESKYETWFLAISSLVFSKLLLSSLNDVEGPNLLIVFVGAIPFYIVALLSYGLLPQQRFVRWGCTVLVQGLLMVVLRIALVHW